MLSCQTEQSGQSYRLTKRGSHCEISHSTVFTSSQQQNPHLGSNLTTVDLAVGPGQWLSRDDVMPECGRENRCECVQGEGTPGEETLGEEGCELQGIFWALPGVLGSLGLS